MAEVIAKNLMPKLAITSMGVAATNGSPASENARRTVACRGLSLASHKSKIIDPKLLSGAKLVLTMTRSHMSFVKSLCKGANAFTLADYAGRGGDISDPFGADIKIYQECAAEIESLITYCVEKIVDIANQD